MKTGILGGTFDPVHLGHLAIAEKARQRLRLRRVIFVPAGQPWLKADREITPASHRIKMVELAIADKPYFEVSTVEADRRGPSYTVDTLAVLQQKLGAQAKLFLIVGWDSLNELPEWYNPAALVKMCSLVAVTRPDSTKPDLEALEALVPGIKQSTILLDIAPVAISSTDIRNRVVNGLSLSGLVPDKVASYIREQKLYRYALAD